MQINTGSVHHAALQFVFNQRCDHDLATALWVMDDIRLSVSVKAQWSNSLSCFLCHLGYLGPSHMVTTPLFRFCLYGNPHFHLTSGTPSSSYASRMHFSFSTLASWRKQAVCPAWGLDAHSALMSFTWWRAEGVMSKAEEWIFCVMLHHDCWKLNVGYLGLTRTIQLVL